MKILHFYKTYYPDTFGGIEQAIFQLASGTSSLGVSAKVLSVTPNQAPRSTLINGHQSVKCRRNFKVASTDFSLSVFWHFKEMAEEADIVHYHFPWPLMDLAHLITNHKKPTVVTYHSDIVKQQLLLKFYRPLRRMFLDSVDTIVATSPNYLVSSDVLQSYQDKVEVIPIGLDRNLYPPINIERRKYWQNLLGKKFFLFIGVLRYYKGLHILLDALSLGGNFTMVIIGAGPIEGELRAKAKSKGLQNVTFLGQVSDEDKVVIIDLSYSVVFPSHLRSEAFGISLLEGAMYGKPMISSEIGTGTSFININEKTGIIVNPSSPKDLNLAMSYLWGNPEVAAIMGLNANKRFEKLFTSVHMCKAYVKLYEQLIDKKSKHKFS